MIKRETKHLITVLTIFTVSLALIGGDCTTESEPGLVSLPSPPTSLTLSLEAGAGGSSYSVVTWNPSADENREDFESYRVSTYTVDTNNVNIALVKDSITSKQTHTMQIHDIQRGTRYITRVAGVLEDGTNGNPIATTAYGGVFYNNNGSIDEFIESGPAQSGYGWDPVTGNGVQYAFTEENLPLIDLHLTMESDQLMFKSPNQVHTSGKVTFIDSIGAGSAAFSNTNLQEPAGTSVPVSDENVYLLKLSGNNYIKLWVKEIGQIGDPPYSNVRFEYKVQPIEGMRILKR
ncbi:MAG: fibronectin type III domain-containing protein [Ignavibacteriaceae bacterium]